MSFIRKILDLLKNPWSTPPSPKNTTEQKTPDFKQNDVFPSLEDLKKVGVTTKQVSNLKEEDKEKLVYASQLPAHIFPWVAGMTSGLHLIKFSPTIQSQINSGLLNITGGVARNQSGQIVAHGSRASLLSLSPIILYQVGVVAFGSYHLKKINESLQKTNKKLDEIVAFLSDKRSAEISGQLLELLHLSKGIMEFNRSGNMTEVLNRIDLIKNIRVMNLTNLLHLQKNLQDELNNLHLLKRSSLFKSDKETIDLLNSITRYEIILIDYSRSLLLDIICTEIEVSFSICNSFEEVKSRLSSQEDYIEVLKTQSSKFGNFLNEKVSELIKKQLWNDDKIIQKKRKNIKDFWKQIEKTISDLDITYKSHIQSIKNKTKPKDSVIFLQKPDSNEYKNTA